MIMMLVLLSGAAQGQNPVRISTDTLPCATRQPNYYYSYWYDTTWWYLNPTSHDTFYVYDIPGLDIDTIFYRWTPDRVEFTPTSEAVEGSYVYSFEQYAPHPIRIKGIWGMVSQYAGSTPDNPGASINYHSIHDSTRLPEYFYLYVRDPKVGLPLNDTSSFLERIATVRWDTAQPKMMCLPKTQDPQFAGANGYVHVYEALFDTVITLEGEFWLGGSANSSTWSLMGGHQHFPTVYVSFGQEYGCCLHDALSTGPDGPWAGYDVCNRFSSFGVITDGQRYLEVSSADLSQGLGLYTAYYPDSSYQTITAQPMRGFRFDHWNDGVTDNPRIVFVTSDTSFTAYFASIPQYVLEARSADESLGSVTGGGTYYEGGTATLQAVPNGGVRFVFWDDGVTENPRTVVVTQDTVFTAQFEPIPQYEVEVESSDQELGYVSGRGTYYEGDTVVVEAVPHTGNHFKWWNDSVTTNPRSIVVTQDTSLTAVFGRGSVGVKDADVSGVAFRLVPNPASSVVRCETGSEGFGGGVLTLSDAAGREVLQCELASGTRTLTLDVAELPAGTYFVTLVTKEGTATRRLVVE